MSEAAEDKGLYGELALGLSIAVAGLAVAALPAAVRVSGHGVSLVAAWLALWGSAALPFGLAAGALRCARPIPRGLAGALAGLVVAAPAVIVLARVLKAQTHHRPLGAATFAVAAAVLALGAFALMARLRVNSGRLSSLAFWALVAVSGLGLLVLALPARGSLLDALLLSGIVALGGWLKPPAAVGRAARALGPVALVVAIAAGVVMRSESVRSATRAHAPVLAGPLF